MFRAIPFLAAFALLAAALLTLPASADRVGVLNARPLHSTWKIFEDGCTDLYSLDGAGNPPPAGTDPGATGLGSTSSWNSLAEAYNLQANQGAPPQVSGDVDGLCDDAPWTINGALSTGASQDLFIGPLNFHGRGGYLISDYDVIGTNWAYTWNIDSPFDGSAVKIEFDRTTASTSTGVIIHLFGPAGVDAAAAIAASEESVFPEAPIYLMLDLNGAASWQINLAFIPFKTDRYGPGT
jgi:hypothetical protein